ncbi:hypothetical protein FOCC_FOCC010991 [Frankliniella occidentalis]|nr:hypothetical protein FOCC_FOCC010991 [Frankliniella occidentalis]
MALHLMTLDDVYDVYDFNQDPIKIHWERKAILQINLPRVGLGAPTVRHYPTEAQWNRLLDAVSVDRELQGEFMGPGAAGRMTAKWEQLAAALNAMGGAFKTGEKWKEAFQNLRYRAKRQYADRSRYTRGTDGGPPPAASLGLSPVYQRVLAHVPLQNIIGNPGVPAPLQTGAQKFVEAPGMHHHTPLMKDHKQELHFQENQTET